VLAVACGGGGSKSSDAAKSCGPEGSKIAAIERSEKRNFSSPPERVIDTTKDYIAVLHTDKGEITIDLIPEVAPNTVNNFVYLSCDGFYDGLKFHRYEAGFVIQGGDPRGNGTGGPGYKFNNETSPNAKHDAAGVVAMANAGKDTNGSQFYITLNPAPALDGNYSVFGRVTSGMDAVRNLRVGSVINSVSVQEK
jgi:cyclophilin family peptidyl-prolyl cis-trans isomerase